MAVFPMQKVKPLLVNKEEMIKVMDRVMAEMGVTHNHTETAENARRLAEDDLWANGHRLEDNLASLQIIAERERKLGDGNLAIVLNPDTKRLLADKQSLKMILAKQNKEGQFLPSATRSAPEIRQEMIAEGLDPAENAGSRAVIEMREE